MIKLTWILCQVKLEKSTINKLIGDYNAKSPVVQYPSKVRNFYVTFYFSEEIFDDCNFSPIKARG